MKQLFFAFSLLFIFISIICCRQQADENYTEHNNAVIKAHFDSINQQIDNVIKKIPKKQRNPLPLSDSDIVRPKLSLSKTEIEEKIVAELKHQLKVTQKIKNVSYETSVFYSLQGTKSKIQTAVPAFAMYHIVDNGLNLKITNKDYNFRLMLLGGYRAGNYSSFEKNENNKPEIETEIVTRFDSIKTYFEYKYYTTAEVIRLSLDNPIWEQGEYNIELSQKSSDTLLLTLNYEAFDKLQRIEGVNKKGKKTTAHFDWLRNYYYQDLLGSLKYIIDRLASITGDEAEDVLKSQTFSFSFPRKVSEVILFMGKDAETVSGEINLPNKVEKIVYGNYHLIFKEEINSVNLHGIVDRELNVVVEPQYTSLIDLDNLYYGIKDSLQGADIDFVSLHKLDVENKKLIPQNISFPYSIENSKFHIHELYPISVNEDDGRERWGVKNFKGETIVPAKYSEIKATYSGLIEVTNRIERERFWADREVTNRISGLYNIKGEELLPCKYARIDVDESDTIKAYVRYFYSYSESVDNECELYKYDRKDYSIERILE